MPDTAGPLDRDHRDGLMLGGAIVAVLLLLLFDLSLWGFVIAGS
jgi:hypothetical protein